ncbi:hypothetical protein NLM33_39340 [Bradyrhizobium sp. CCGUVB1N3]|uniref:hypothetical protein n=1 Tax=Bradyrhizobium sp. CCGUVB1N3 TaxID=2949629 RepID=UPI0020B3CC8F|nr:hypothetical protein [Bradyrhizobium sp. CCGUVB1N3]MCP3476276.1 hypothetical protein [Bradyrhizobium sp. CCGUVB1N3]
MRQRQPQGRGALDGGSLRKADECKAEQWNSKADGNRRSGAVDQNRDRSESEQDACDQNTQHHAWILQHEERDCACKRKRHIGYDQLECAVFEFDDRYTGDCDCQHAGQQDRPLEIGNENQQQSRVEEERRDRKHQVFNAAFRQRDSADGRHKGQGQSHGSRMP